MIIAGLSDQEIALRPYLSINSVKTHLQDCHQKINDTTRSRAVMWGVANGIMPDGRQRSSRCATALTPPPTWLQT